MRRIQFTVCEFNFSGARRLQTGAHSAIRLDSSLILNRTATNWIESSSCWNSRLHSDKLTDYERK